MIYEVENLPRRLPIELLDSAILFAASFLKVEFKLLVEFETMQKYLCGLCDYDEDEVIITISKRLSRREAIVTLFHELVHAKQYADGRLEQGSKWLGCIYNCTYFELPWEQEAHSLEKVMMQKFKMEHKV
jgi:hypothetical protein